MKRIWMYLSLSSLQNANSGRDIFLGPRIMKANLKTINLKEPTYSTWGVDMSSNKKAYDDILKLLHEHHDWFDRSIPLIASENVPSPAVREAVMSDFGNRYAEGWPGERVYAGCIYIDQVELICNDLARRVFRAEFADCRATSGVVANLAIYAAFSNPGDWMMAASIPSGGHISH